MRRPSAAQQSLAPRLLRLLYVDQQQTRRCAIWVNTATLMAAQELAELAGVDVDTFVETMVQGLHEEARVRAHGGESSAAAPVIPMNRERRRRRRSGDQG